MALRQGWQLGGDPGHDAGNCDRCRHCYACPEPAVGKPGGSHNLGMGFSAITHSQASSQTRNGRVSVYPELRARAKSQG